MTTTLGGKAQSTNFNDINFKKTKEILKQHLEKTLNKNFESSRTSSNLEGKKQVLNKFETVRTDYIF